MPGTSQVVPIKAPSSSKKPVTHAKAKGLNPDRHRSLTHEQLLTVIQQRVEKGLRHRDLTHPREAIPHAEDEFKEHLHLHKHAHLSKKKHAIHVDTVHHDTNTTEFQKFPVWKFQVPDFTHYGLGVELYFVITRALMVLFFILSVVTSPVVFTNLWNSGDVNDMYYSGLWVEKFSVGYLRNGTRTTTVKPLGFSWQYLRLFYVLMDVLVVILLVVFTEYLKSEIKTAKIIYDKREICASMYTVQVRGLPETFKNSDRPDLAAHFEKSFGKVMDVCLYFDHMDVVTEFAMRGKASEMLQAAELEGNERLIGKYKTLKSHCSAKLNTIKQKYDNAVLTTAFVTFECLKAHNKCLKAFARRMPKPGTRASVRAGEDFSFAYFRTHKLRVKPAYEPSNMKPENLNVPRRTTRWRMAGSVCAALVLIAVTSALLGTEKYFENVYFRDFINRSEGCSEAYGVAGPSVTLATNTAGQKIKDCYCHALGMVILMGQNGVSCPDYLSAFKKRTALAAGSVVTLVSINAVLKFVAARLGKWERHHSLTEELLSITNGISVSLILNQGFVMMAVNSKRVFGGLFLEFSMAWYPFVGTPIFFTMIACIFFPTLLPLVQQMWFAFKKKNLAHKKIHFSQTEMNDYLMGGEFDLSERYAIVTANVFCLLMYSGGMPALYFCGFLIFFVQYWVDKYAFLRYYRTPPRVDSSLAKNTVWGLYLSCVVHICFSVWMFCTAQLEGQTQSTNQLVYGDEIFSNQLKRALSWESIPLFVVLGVQITIELYTFLTGKDACKCLHKKKVHHTRIPYSVAKEEYRLETYHPEDNEKFKQAYHAENSVSGLQLERAKHLEEEMMSAEEEEFLAKHDKHGYVDKLNRELDRDLEAGGSKHYHHHHHVKKGGQKHKGGNLKSTNSIPGTVTSP